MKCTHCKAELQPDEPICSYCNSYNMLETEKVPEENENKIDGWLKFAFILALIPILLILYCFIAAGGDYSEDGPGAVMWLLIIYYWTFGIPFAITSLVISIKRIRKYDSNFARLVLGLTLSPFVLFAIALLTS